MLRFLLSQLLRGAMARQVVAQPRGTRVVRVGRQVLLTEGGQCVQAIPPLFGHVSGRKGLTHWLVFMKPEAAE